MSMGEEEWSDRGPSIVLIHQKKMSCAKNFSFMSGENKVSGMQQLYPVHGHSRSLKIAKNIQFCIHF